MNTTRTSLLVRIKNQEDATAWSEFDTLYRPILFRYALTRGLDEADAEDVVQHCMAAVHRHIRAFEYDPRKGRFRGWLSTIASNYITSLHRKRREPVTPNDVLGQIPNRDTAPDEAFARLWLEEHLKRCLERVRSETDEDTFQAYYRYVIEEWPAHKVCEAFQINAARLYKIKWRLTRKLQEHMQELLGEDESAS